MTEATVDFEHELGLNGRPATEPFFRADRWEVMLAAAYALALLAGYLLTRKRGTDAD